MLVQEVGNVVKHVLIQQYWLSNTCLHIQIKAIIGIAYRYLCRVDKQNSMVKELDVTGSFRDQFQVGEKICFLNSVSKRMNISPRRLTSPPEKGLFSILWSFQGQT